MPALNYTVFVDKVESGEKRQTIRRLRKRPIKVGDRLHHFAGMRTKHCRRLRAEEEDYCKTEQRIRRESGLWYQRQVRAWLLMSWADIELIARRDGFECFWDFDQWFSRYDDGEILQVIRW